MATIERKPLPPPGRGAITITSTDRADLTNSARDLINHYMFGNGSWWDAGPRKSWDHPVSDLKAFKEAVLGLDQFVDDPDSILPSIKAMIERAIGQANDELKKGWDVDNNIRKTLPDSNDRMEVTPPEPNIQILKPEPRKLSISNAPASGVRADWPSTPARPASFDDRFGDWGASAPAGAPVGASQTDAFTAIRRVGAYEYARHSRLAPCRNARFQRRRYCFSNIWSERAAAIA
jgi:hypothetical protein